MATEIKYSNIHYTRGDTFRLTISVKDSEVSSGTELRFVITRAEHETPVIDKSVKLNADGKFVLELSEGERERLNGKKYIWKATLYYPDGDIQTERSGGLIVKWGA